MRDYNAVTTNYYRYSPRFQSTVTMAAGSIGASVDSATSLQTLFDIRTCTNASLDMIGVWVGRTRVFYKSGLGLLSGGSSFPYLLDDTAYRHLLNIYATPNPFTTTHLTNLCQAMGGSYVMVNSNQPGIVDVDIALGVVPTTGFMLIPEIIADVPKPLCIRRVNYYIGINPFFFDGNADNGWDQGDWGLLAG